MRAIASFALVASSSIPVLVGAFPQHHGNPACPDQTTVTVTAPAVADPTSPSDANEQVHREKAVTTITETITVVRTVEAVPESSTDSEITQTVTVFTTETSTITVQSPPETEIPGPTTEPQESPSPEPAPSSPPINRPHFGNATQPWPYDNSSLPSNTSSSGLPIPPILPRPSSTATGDSYSGFVLPPSPGYENSLYFTNWSVALWPPLRSPPTDLLTEPVQGNIWRKLPAAVHPCLQDHSCILCIRLVQQ